MIAYKVVPVYLDPDQMEEVNIMTGLDAFRECNWCDLDAFIDHPDLTKYVGHEDYKRIRSGKIDFVAFRLDY